MKKLAKFRKNTVFLSKKNQDRIKPGRITEAKKPQAWGAKKTKKEKLHFCGVYEYNYSKIPGHLYSNTIS